MDDKASHDWQLPIQPSTLVALLGTFTRAALMSPLSEWIGHLKWAYFETPRPLDRMRTFDSASRGPLGAPLLLWRLKNGSPLASTAAAVVIVLLLSQPFMQQAIVFTSRLAPLSNETAFAFQSSAWSMDLSSEQPYRPTSREAFFPALSHGLYRAIINETSIDLPNVYCSTSMCEFPQYDTLAIFSQCKEHLESANALEDFDICTWRNDTGTEFRDPLLINVRREIERRRWRENFNSTLTCARDSSGFWFGMRINNTLRLAEQLLTSLELRPFGSSYPGQLTQTAIQQDNASEGTRAKACEYRAASDNASTTILDTTCVDMDTDMRRYLKANSTTDQFGDVDATVTKCTLLPCVKRLAASRSQADHTSLEVLNTSLAARSVTGTSEYQTSPSHVWYCAGIAAECSFMYSVPALLFLGLWIQSVMNTHQYAQYHFSGGSSDNSTSFYQRIAGQISDLFRTPSNLNATNVNGFAYGTEVYVQDYGHCDVKEPELYTRTKNLWFERGSRIFVAIAMYWKDIYTSKADAHTSTRCHHH